MTSWVLLRPARGLRTENSSIVPRRIGPFENWPLARDKAAPVIGRVSSGIVPSQAAWAISQLNLPADAFAAIRTPGDRVVAATIVSGETYPSQGGV